MTLATESGFSSDFHRDFRNHVNLTWPDQFSCQCPCLSLVYTQRQEHKGRVCSLSQSANTAHLLCARCWEQVGEQDVRSLPSWRIYSHFFYLNIPSLIGCHPIQSETTDEKLCMLAWICYICKKHAFSYSVGMCLLCCTWRTCKKKTSLENSCWIKELN